MCIRHIDDEGAFYSIYHDWYRVKSSLTAQPLFFMNQRILYDEIGLVNDGIVNHIYPAENPVENSPRNRMPVGIAND